MTDFFYGAICGAVIGAAINFFRGFVCAWIKTIRARGEA
jgi:hypothetical protein